MTKKNLIKNIIEEANIHHNIKISFSKLPDHTDDDNFNWEDIAEYMLDFWMDDMMYIPENDSGNRNLCGCKDKEGKRIIPCKKHDFWHFYTYGRNGATLYWDKYWKETNSSLYFHHDDELEDMDVEELKEIYKEIKMFNERVEDLMTGFYAGCKYKLEEAREEKAREEKEEKDYQKTLAKVKKENYIKKLVNDII